MSTDFSFTDGRDVGKLRDRINNALYSVPSNFETAITIDGLDVDDLFSLNTAIGSSVERSVVETLNSMRSVWDPDGEYTDCSFVRQSQTFPDVILTQRQNKGQSDPIIGIELKSWYLLSKEQEPSFRYEVTPDACADDDLLVIYPWALKNVLSGEPQVFEPYIINAKEASEKVDEYWQQGRNTSLDTTINRPSGVTPYPDTSEEIQDKPVADSGDNYGRLSRAGIMDSYIERMRTKDLAGVTAEDWIEFIKNY